MKHTKQTWIVFIAATLFSSLGIALQVKANLGISMVAAPAYILSLRLEWLSFGQAEWLIQGFLYILCCLLTKKFQSKILYSFVVAIPYGAVLDGMLWLCDKLSPSDFISQILIFLLGSVILALGIALFFHSDLPCQMYEMFVKTMAGYWGMKPTTLKLVYDWSSLLCAVIMTIVFFQAIRGIGIGTILCTIINAPLIQLWNRLIQRKIYQFL